MPEDMAMFRADYGYLDLGTPDGNLAFRDEITGWLQEIGNQAIERGYAVSMDIAAKNPPLSSKAAGTVALYLVSESNPDYGATLVVTHREIKNTFMPGRADGVHIHAQARLLKEGRWVSVNYKADPVPLISTEDAVVLDLLKKLLTRTTPNYPAADAS